MKMTVSSLHANSCLMALLLILASAATSFGWMMVPQKATSPTTFRTLSSSSSLLMARPRKDDGEGGEDVVVRKTKRASGSSSSSSGASPSANMNMDPAKRAALDGVLNQIERSYGRGSIVKLGDADHMIVDCIGSGALTLDVALGGGYPKGRVIEIYGPESSGKTTLALHAIAEAQKQGGVAAFIDAEHALDPNYAAGLGVDVNALLVSQPDSGEMALDVVDQLVRSSAVDVIVIDSVAALVPRAELEGDMSDQQIGLQARLMSKAMRKITGSLPLSQCTVIFLNQLRSKIGVMYGSPEVTAGGNALKYYASVRLDTRRKEILPDNIGIRVKVKVVKNKVAPPFKAVNLDILFGGGIDRHGCTLDAALDLGIVERKGSWYAYQGSNIAQGRASVVELMKQEESSFGLQLENEVRLALSANAGAQADVEAVDNDEESDDGDDDGDSNEMPMRAVDSNAVMMEETEELYLEA